jgi:hypothetical protein
VHELLDRFHVREIRPDVIVCAIRRAGKTFAVALFAAAFISTQPGVELVVYSTAKRASRKLQALIYKMVVTLAGGPEVVEVFNQEELVVKCGNATSKVISLPSSVEISFFPSPTPPPLSLSPLVPAQTGNARTAAPKTESRRKARTP